MTWRLAKSLAVLRLEANSVAPTRAKHHDGTIGDAAHASRASRHNPNDAGVVCALDITHDPANGMDTYSLFDWLRLNPHLDLEYVISNRRIASRRSGFVTKAYYGSSAHDLHIHVAVGRGPDSEPTPPYDDLEPWGLREWKEGTEEEVSELDHELLVRGRIADIGTSYDLAILKTDDPIEKERLKVRRQDDIRREKDRLDPDKKIWPRP